LLIVGLNPPGFTLATDNATAQFPRERDIIKEEGRVKAYSL